MAKKNDDFFTEKKSWSVVKDELLGCYFKPYVSKILHTYKPLVYVDCFAGKGQFDDGKPGSPLIALDIINQCQEHTSVSSTNIEATFIDLNYADDLRKNLPSHSWIKIVSGKYEDNICDILNSKKGSNVFLYIDPYGIKALQCSLFDDFAMGQFHSIELLINLNSFGFIREACHAMGTSFDDKELFDDLVEYTPTKMDASDKSIEDLSMIAGDDYWIPIIVAKKQNKIDGYEAEAQFAEQYCKRLMKNYKYVLNMPLRIKRNQRPKYRLVHATNHRDGCLLMVDNICNRWESLQEIQTSGQTRLWEENYDNQIVDIDDIEKKVVALYSQLNNWTSLHESLASFFITHGPICSTGTVKNVLKKLESAGRLQIFRKPATTKNGKPSRFMNEDGKQSVLVRWQA